MCRKLFVITYDISQVRTFEWMPLVSEWINWIWRIKYDFNFVAFLFIVSNKSLKLRLGNWVAVKTTNFFPSYYLYRFVFSVLSVFLSSLSLWLLYFNSFFVSPFLTTVVQKNSSKMSKTGKIISQKVSISDI